MITLKLLDSVPQITDKVNTAIAEQINDTLSKNIYKIVEKCKALAVQWVMEQPEMLSLKTSGINSLTGQFGISGGDGSSAASAIAQAVGNSISVKFIPYNKNFRGGLEINIQPSTFVNLLGLKAGHTVYEGGDLHWLNWLLTQGDRIIVTNYQYNPQTGLGRSGLGNMNEGGFFRVPPEFSGTEDNNFITRALIGTAQEKAISKVIYDLLK